MGTVEVTVGRVGRAHGLGGEVRVDVRTDSPERRFTPRTAFDTPHGRLTVASTRWHQGRLLVRFAEVGDRTAAEALRGLELSMRVPADERPDDPEEYYDHQLVGLVVVDDADNPLGRVRAVLHLPGQDVLAVDTLSRGERLVPFVAELVPAVDLAGGRVVVTPPEGLFDDAEEPGHRAR